MKNLFYVVLLGLSTIIGGVISYFYHPLMIRYLSINEFAEFESLVGMFNILGVLTSGIGLFLVKEISKNSKSLEKVKSIFLLSNKFLSIAGILIYLIFCLFSPLIRDFLKFDSTLPIILTGIIIIFSFQGTVVGATLQGLKRFKFISAMGIIGQAIKLGFGLLFVILGFKLYGAIGGFLASGLVGFLINFFYVYRLLKDEKHDEDMEGIKKDFKKEFTHVFNFFLLVFLLSIFMNIDLIFAKSFFDGNTAGIYAGLSIIAKFLIFLGGAVETVYYPQIMEYKKEDSPKHFFVNSFLMLLILLASALIFSYFFAPFILDLMKEGFGAYLKLFLMIMTYCGIYNFINLYSKILIGWKNYLVNYLLSAVLVLMIGSLFIFTNGNINTFISIFIISGAVTFIGIFALFLHAKKRIK
ncbi:MAG: oligosaccharide flippase family protein [Candidatus Gracilibacteria bacterium]|nr:oligosaccharide flippase family protein [Candidatus Gracilibacteria bacterium]